MTSPTIIDAWQVVTRAAVAYAKSTTGDTEANRALHDAVLAYAEARKPARPAGPVVLVPFGRDKGKPLSECDPKNLRWLLGAVSESIDNEDKARWRQQNVELRDAIEAELQTR